MLNENKTVEAGEMSVCLVHSPEDWDLDSSTHVASWASPQTPVTSPPSRESSRDRKIAGVF